jgi:16S rRNA (guanine966-N2)-methyltransferase
MVGANARFIAGCGPEQRPFPLCSAPGDNRTDQYSSAITAGNLLRKHPKKAASQRPSPLEQGPAELRIIGGHFRGRKLAYSGDPRTRPMKDRVRESVFNLLGEITGDMHAVDLFAGTGALGLEALSRGAGHATFIEQHFPTAAVIRQNAETLGCLDRVTIAPANTFIWAKRNPDLGERPWIVFCSPPYAFYVDRRDEMLELIGSLVSRAPAGSEIVVEADDRFEFGDLPKADQWRVRRYPPAVVGILRIAAASHDDALHEG